MSTAALFPNIARATTSTLKFGSVGGLSDAGIYLAEEAGHFATAGITVEMQRINSAPTLVTATAASQLDLAGISITPGLFAAVARGINLRIIGDKQSFRAGFSGTRLIARPAVLKATAAQTIANLRGKTVAVSARGAATYYLLSRALAKQGLTLAQVKTAELAYANMVPAFSTGAIDAAIILEPFLTQTLRSGQAKEVSDLVAFAPGGQMVIVPLVMSETIAKNRSIVQAFMTAYMQGVRTYNDAFAKNKNKEKAVEVIARRSGVDVSIVGASFPSGLDPDQRVNPAALQSVQAFFVNQNMLAAPIDVNALIDPSFARSSVASLGPY